MCAATNREFITMNPLKDLLDLGHNPREDAAVGGAELQLPVGVAAKLTLEALHLDGRVLRDQNGLSEMARQPGHVPLPDA